MKRFAVLILAIADALLTALAGIGIPWLVVTVAQLLASGLAQDWGAGLSAAAGAWALSLGGAVDITIDPTTGIPVGIAQALGFRVALAPLGLTIVTIALAARTGARTRDDDAPWASLAVAAVAFGVVVGLVTALVSSPVAAIDVARTTALAMALFAVSALAGARAWELVRADDVIGWMPHEWRAALVLALRGAGLMLVSLVGVASLLLLVAAFAGAGRSIALAETLHLDPAGAIVLGVAGLAVLPDLIVWALAWLLGPGFSLGAATSVSPGGTLTGPLPVIPVLGFVPESMPAAAYAVVAIPVAIGFAAAVWMRTRPVDIDLERGGLRLGAPVAAAAFAAIAAWLLAIAASGPIGPGRLAEFGPSAPWVLLAAFATLAVGALVGMYAPIAPAGEASGASVGAGRAGSGRSGDAPMTGGDSTASRDGRRAAASERARAQAARAGAAGDDDAVSSLSADETARRRWAAAARARDEGESGAGEPDAAAGARSSSSSASSGAKGSEAAERGAGAAASARPGRESAGDGKRRSHARGAGGGGRSAASGAASGPASGPAGARAGGGAAAPSAGVGRAPGADGANGSTDDDLDAPVGRVQGRGRADAGERRAPLRGTRKGADASRDPEPGAPRPTVASRYADEPDIYADIDLDDR